MKIINWKIDIQGGIKELNSIDQFGNLIDLVSIQNNSKKIEYNIFGKVETKSNFGIKEISKKEHWLPGKNYCGNHPHNFYMFFLFNYIENRFKA